MNANDIRWEDYYQRVAGREPRPLLIDVVNRFASEPTDDARHAIDLGSGDGTETAYLLAHGWHVLAVDVTAAAFDLLRAKTPTEAQARLQTQVAKFEDVTLAPSDLIYSGYSLPFCHPTHFDSFWEKIVQDVKPGGRFAGQLFGVNDTWATSPDMTFLTEPQARARFTGFELEYFHEEDADGFAASGPKHWHVFHVIARKR